MGTWIEMTAIEKARAVFNVVPLVGTWIEITTQTNSQYMQLVVPLVGTWIEILTAGLHVHVCGRAPRGHVD